MQNRSLSETHPTNSKNAHDCKQTSSRSLPDLPTGRRSVPLRPLPPRPLPPPPPPPKSPKSRPLLSINTTFVKSTFNLPSPYPTQNLPLAPSNPRHQYPPVLFSPPDAMGSHSSRPSCSTDTLSDSLFKPQIPTPNTARKKRIMKLQRHLGEKIPPDLVPLAHVPAPQGTQHHEASPLYFLPIRGVRPAAIVAPTLIRRFHENSSVPDSEADPDSEEEKSEELWDPAVSLYGEKKAPISDNDKRWIWEKDGRRWGEDDYTGVVRALRSL